MPLAFEEKQALLHELRARLEAEHKKLLAAQKATHDGATHEEARPENDKDTRALEQSYLARGQAERVAQLETDVEALNQLVARPFHEGAKVSLGAVVSAEDEDGVVSHYFVAPSGAAEVLSCSLGKVKVVTPRSPLGQALLGSSVGADVEVRSPTGARMLSLIEIS